MQNPSPSNLPADSPMSDLEARASRKARRLMMIYLFVGQMFVQVDRTNIGFAKLTMSKDLALTATAFGLASGIFALSAFLMQVPAGLLFERLGARRWLTAIMAGWGLVCVAQAFVTSAAALVVLRFLLGGLEAGFVPGLYILINQWFRGDRHGSMLAGLMAGTAASGILGGPFAGWVLGHHFLGLAGWRSLFLVEGALTSLWAVFASRYLCDGPEQARWLTSDERAAISRHLADYHARKVAGGAVEKPSFGAAIRDARILLLTLAYTCAGWVTATMAFFLPTLLERAGKGASPQTVGLLAVGPSVAMAVVAFTWGAHADRTERHWHCVLPLLFAAAGILLYPVATTPLSAMACLAMVQAGNVGFFVTFWPTCNSIVGRKTISRSTAVINSGNHVGNFVAPFFFGWALDASGGTSLGLYVCVAVLLLNFVLMNTFFIRHKLRGQSAAAA